MCNSGFQIFVLTGNVGLKGRFLIHVEKSEGLGLQEIRSGFKNSTPRHERLTQATMFASFFARRDAVLLFILTRTRFLGAHSAPNIRAHEQVSRGASMFLTERRTPDTCDARASFIDDMSFVLCCLGSSSSSKAIRKQTP